MYRANEEQVRKAQEANVHYSILTLLNYSILTLLNYRANEEQVRKAQEALEALRSENAGLLCEKNELMGQKVFCFQ